ncbi:MAG: DNA-directed RNA polymerase subunit K [Candidatus Helarchaeota archaeon]
MVKKGKKIKKKKVKTEEELIEEPKEPIEVRKKAFKLKTGPSHLTKYERARIIGARALQISMSAPILLSDIPESKDPIQIAEQELDLGLLPMTIRRKLPDGKYEDIPLIYLLNSNY